MCKVFKLSRSAYYAWKERLSKSCKGEEEILMHVRQIHRDSDGTYGTRRISKALQSMGIPCGRRRAKTLMKRAGVAVKQRKMFRITTQSKHNLPVAPNLLKRQFDVSEPNRVWVSDITYIWTREGWLYLAVVMDLFSRQIVGWSMSPRINKKLVMDAQLMAIWQRKLLTGLISHSDRGSQYCSHAFQQLLKAHKIDCSMSRKGDCWERKACHWGTMQL
jgi:transposase InsO family protein